MEPAVSSTRHCRGYMFNIKLTTVSLSQSPQQDAGEFSYFLESFWSQLVPFHHHKPGVPAFIVSTLLRHLVDFENINLK